MLNLVPPHNDGIPEGVSADDPRHGTINAYRNLRCRCLACKAENTLKMADYRARLRQRPIPDGTPHNASCYENYGCRCPQCRAAKNEQYLKSVQC